MTEEEEIGLLLTQIKVCKMVVTNVEAGMTKVIKNYSKLSRIARAAGVECTRIKWGPTKPPEGK